MNQKWEIAKISDRINKLREMDKFKLFNIGR